MYSHRSLLAYYHSDSVFMPVIQKPDIIAGSTLLGVIDQFALNNHNIAHPVTSDNIGKQLLVYNNDINYYDGYGMYEVFLVKEISLNDTEDEFISGVSEERAKIRIPRIILERS